MISPFLLLVGIMAMFTFVFFIIVAANDNKKYRYRLIIHELVDGKPVPRRMERAKIEKIDSLDSGKYTIVFLTKTKRRIPLHDVERHRVVAGRILDEIIYVFTPDEVQYFPMKPRKLKDGFGIVPDFSKNRMAIVGAINAIRYARMLASKAWQQFLQVAIPVFMVFLLVGGGITMFIYASDYSKNIKEASFIIVNATKQQTEIMKQLVKLNEMLYNKTQGKVPIGAVG